MAPAQQDACHTDGRPKHGLAIPSGGTTSRDLRPSYYRARYYDPGAGRFLSEDALEFGAGNGANFYSYAINSPVSWVDPFGMDITCPSFLAWLCIPPPPPIPVKLPPWYAPSTKYHAPVPSVPLGKLLNCIGRCYGQPLFYTSTSEVDPKIGHVPDTPHGRGEAADIIYPQNPDRLLCCASDCGAGKALDEKKHPSPKATGPHIHIQLFPGPGGGRGNLPPGLPLSPPPCCK